MAGWTWSARTNTADVHGATIAPALPWESGSGDKHLISSESKTHARFYRAAMEFSEVAERRRKWTLFGDIPWEKIDTSRNTPERATCIETFCAEELYLPDYASHGSRMTRSVFGLAWFLARWSFEESRHGLVFREYLIRSGMRSEREFEMLEDMVFAKSWVPPFSTIREMACYGALQEGVTYLAYKAQKDKAEAECDDVLTATFSVVGIDEAAHAGFYRKVVGIEMDDDRTATIADFAHVLANFEMPGDGLIAGYHERLKTGGGGVSPRQFMGQVVLPTLRSLGISRSELKSAQAQDRMAAEAARLLS